MICIHALPRLAGGAFLDVPRVFVPRWQMFQPTFVLQPGFGTRVGGTLRLRAIAILAGRAGNATRLSAYDRSTPGVGHQTPAVRQRPGDQQSGAHPSVVTRVPLANARGSEALIQSRDREEAVVKYKAAYHPGRKSLPAGRVHANRYRRGYRLQPNCAENR